MNGANSRGARTALFLEMQMLDTLAIRQAAEAPAEMATKADLANLRADLYRAMLVQAGTIVAAVVGAAFAIVRMLG